LGTFRSVEFIVVFAYNRSGEYMYNGGRLFACTVFDREHHMEEAVNLIDPVVEVVFRFR
jgi:hypothetical protein